jgi:hypothetical protein
MMDSQAWDAVEPTRTNLKVPKLGERTLGIEKRRVHALDIESPRHHEDHAFGPASLRQIVMDQRH